MSEQVRIGVDIGGTFTDIALEVDQRLFTLKVLTTDARPEQAVIEGLKEVIAEAGIQTSDVSLIIHGTTLATNALIQRSGARTALITTEGFRDVIEIRSEGRYEQYDLDIDLPEPLVPRNLRVPVRERIAADGEVLLALDLDGVDRLCDQLQAQEVESIAVGLIHSYANAAHEQRIRDHLQTRLPHVMFSLSCEVAPEMREFERFTTTCANAYVQPLIASYLERLQQALTGMGVQCPLFLMHSGGGMIDVDTAIRFPVRLVESGPAGGAIFASHIASIGGFERVLSLDVGGTTAKICLIDDGRPQNDRVFEVARIYKYRKGSGTPLLIPVINMVEIGAGGGSIAHVDTLGRLAVGPQSAGAEPGPACYARGGEQPTVTDANLLIGRLASEDFAGGSMNLDVDAARRTLSTEIGSALALSAELAAQATIEIVDENMANASRMHAVESGKDLGRYTLIAFGGCAPLHAAELARKLGIARVVIPPGAGVGSAIGFLRAPFAYEAVRSGYCPVNEFDADFANALVNELSAEARSMVARGVANGEIEELRYAYMRYRGQGYDIRVPLPNRELSDADVADLAARFNAEYTALFGQTIPGISIEILTWSVLVRSAGTVARAAPIAAVPAERAPTDGSPQSERAVLDCEGNYNSVAVYPRQALARGVRLRGPAVVTEAQTTTVVPSGCDLTLDESGFLILTLV